MNKNLIIDASETLKTALTALEENHFGFLCVLSKESVLVGVLTDGDIRRGMLNKASLSDKVKRIANKKFIFAKEDVSQDEIIALFEKGIKFIPIVSSDGTLKKIEIATKSVFIGSKIMVAQSIAPARLSFAGGGSDVAYFYNRKNLGCVVNTTINKFARCKLTKRDDHKVVINSLDLNLRVEEDSIDDLIERHPRLKLVATCIKEFSPDYGFELVIKCDFSLGSGMGGSSAVLAAVCGVLQEFSPYKYTKKDIAEICYKIERINCGIAGGWQDQLSTVYGGLNTMEFTEKNKRVIPLIFDEDFRNDLSSHLYLVDLEISHNSGLLHAKQENDIDTSELSLNKNVEIAIKMTKAVETANFQLFVHLMKRAWSIKRKTHQTISNKLIDNVYDTAIESGALAGKLMGAGGGGTMAFLIELENYTQVKTALSKLNYKLEKVEIINKGVISWAG